MDIACKQFLNALKDAEETGASTDARELCKSVTSGHDPVLIFKTCKDKGWVMGTHKGAWMTPEGRKQIAP
jgi:hypothetical protein